jgi:dynein heavy chain
MVTDFMDIFAKWSEKIESVLEEQAGARNDKDEGPRDELDYWKLRMRMLTTVSESIRSTNCKDVQNVLTVISTSDNNKHADSGIYLALSNWRSIELRVTENLNEAKDNVKYLQTLERFIPPLRW